MSLVRTVISFSFFFCSVSCMDLSCMEQYNPRPFWKKLDEEQKTANRQLSKLSKKGELPETKEASTPTAKETQASKEGGSGVSEAGEKAFNTFCVTCHGSDGSGDTPVAAALNPKPRAFSDKSWQESVTDEHILKVITEGGASVGLSPLMAPWGGVLSDEQTKGLVQKIRSFKK